MLAKKEGLPAARQFLASVGLLAHMDWQQGPMSQGDLEKIVRELQRIDAVIAE